MAATKGSKAFAEAIKEQGHGAQIKMARELSVDPTLLSRWKNGEYSPSAGYRLALQELLDIPWQAWDEPAEVEAS